MVESDSGSPPDQAADRTKAVAVKRRDETALPRITATGRGKLAEQILDIAFANDVKVRQDKELVDILDAYEVDSPVPLEALGAVSEILRYVYAANHKLAPATKNAEDSDENADQANNDPDEPPDEPDEEN
ncbi:MAG: EscU/YscU/HrcU family type III secretion system export apparatus switch protein [Proteobacteria bacterium]|nr:EscU/YscU/HrcU family type III secretion system export apparatus switch protein [Pseudomonadota bacterium]